MIPIFAKSLRVLLSCVLDIIDTVSDAKSDQYWLFNMSYKL